MSLLAVEDLNVRFATPDGEVHAVVRDDAGEALRDPAECDRVGLVGHLVDLTWICPAMIAALYASSCGTMSSTWPPEVE